MLLSSVETFGCTAACSHSSVSDWCWWST